MRLHHNISYQLNRLTWHISHNKLLLVAIIISIILHSLVLTQPSISLPELNVNHQMLEMRLVKSQPTLETKPTLIQKETPSTAPTPPSKEPIPAVTQAQPDAELTPTHDIVPLAEPVPITEDTPDNTSPLSPQQVEPVIAESPPTEPTETIAELGNADDTNKHQSYQYVETEFEVRRGNDTSAVGEATIIFSAQQDNTAYTLTSTTEAKGLASLFFNTLKQTSEGVITDNGLRPNHYRYQYGDDDKKLQYANFAWSDGVIEMHSVKGVKTENISDGTQDLLSFMYQFMFVPPLANMQITITNGKNLRMYTYRFEGEEMLATKLGELKTIHIVKSGDKDEKTELWLATDYQYLPVKVRKTEKNGSVIEQIVTDLSTNRPE